MSSEKISRLKLALSFDEEFQQLDMKDAVNFSLEQIRALVNSEDKRLDNMNVHVLINNVIYNKDILLLIKYAAKKGNFRVESEIKDLLDTFNKFTGISNQYKDDHLEIIRSIVHMQPQVQFISEIAEYGIKNIKQSHAINTIFFEGFEYKCSSRAINTYSEKVLRAALERKNTFYLSIHDNKEYVKHHIEVYKEYSDRIIKVILDESILNNSFTLNHFVKHLDYSSLKSMDISDVFTFIDHLRKSNVQLRSVKAIIKEQFTIDECRDLIVNIGDEMNRNSKHTFFGIAIDYFIREDNLNQCDDKLKSILHTFIDAHYSYDDGRVELINILSGQSVPVKPASNNTTPLTVKIINEMSEYESNKIFTDFNNSDYSNHEYSSNDQLVIMLAMTEYCIYDTSSIYKEYIKKWLNHNLTLNELTPRYKLFIAQTSSKTSFMELIINIDKRTAKHYVKYLV